MAVKRQAIGDHAAIGDGQTAALVSRDGTVDWLCWPRFDSPSLFGALLDRERGGLFSLRPGDGFTPTRSYVGDTNVLRTVWRSRDGEAEVEVLDWMAIADPSLRRRRIQPESALVRRVRCLRGTVPLLLTFTPRPDYGRARRHEVEHWPFGDRVRVGSGSVRLQTAPRVSLDAESGRTRITLRAGETFCAVLSFSSEAPEVVVEPFGFAEESLAATLGAWHRFSAVVRYDGPWRDLVVRSALALELLLHAPTSTFVAAATTSLPERPGGDLNWDYRYSWVRDAALTVRALESLGFELQADDYVSWLLHSTRLSRPEMHVMYDVWGRPSPREETLDHWSGYEGASPVRIGNAAAVQLQLDTYGEVVDAVAHVVRRGGRIDRETATLLRDFGEFVCRHWQLPDAGIWELRDTPKHHTHSKVSCWTALERLLEVDRRQHLRRFPRDRFALNRELLRRDIRANAWSPRIGAYTQAYGDHRLDASVLLMSWYGFEPASSQRMRQTARAILRRLSPAPGLLYRYDQSLANGEGTFVICAFWFAEFLARGGGTLEDAEQCFAAAVRYANDLGLLAEEVEPRTGEALGNFPQAFSHVGLIGAAVSLEERRRHDASVRGRARAPAHRALEASP